MRGFKIAVCIQAVIDLLSDAIRLSVPIVSDPKTGIALECLLDLDLMDYFTMVLRASRQAGAWRT
ncbi:MAG: hypothetical protein U1B83_05985 [Candidatus Cloacimonadaceae bacterium]|nr:hypothetical protein [Candidatus Cloacimonadaceae bacterium]